MLLTDIPKGTHVRVRESVGCPSRGVWTTAIEGEMVGCFVESHSALQNAFASSPSGGYPLCCLRLRESDGNLTDLVLDSHSVAEIIP
jgi:hypothetical protein